VNVFGCDRNKDEEALSLEAIDCIEGFIDELGIPKTLRELGAKEEMLPKIADSICPESGGYKTLTKDDVLEILKECY
jgi:alcohol dehydrogenase class IV